MKKPARTFVWGASVGLLAAAWLGGGATVGCSSGSPGGNSSSGTTSSGASTSSGGSTSGSGSGANVDAGPPPVVTGVTMAGNPSVSGRGAPITEVLITGTNLVPADDTLIGTGNQDYNVSVSFGAVSAGSVYSKTATTLQTAIPMVPSYGSYPVTVQTLAGVSAPFPFSISCNQTGEGCGADPGSQGGTGKQGCCNGCNGQTMVCN
jgi:hypothetical protein